MRITHLGHACLLVEAAGERVLIDPGTLSSFQGTRGIDAVFVTHSHHDHLDRARVPGLLEENPEASIHADPLSTEILSSELGISAETLLPGARVSVGQLHVRVVGEKHAFNNDRTPVVPNAGLVLSANDEPTLFHPGDAYDADPGEIDILAHPLNAPWAASADSIEFVRRLQPGVVIPIHDALLSDAGRMLYGSHIRQFTDLPDMRYIDLANDESVTV